MAIVLDYPTVYPFKCPRCLINYVSYVPYKGKCEECKKDLRKRKYDKKHATNQ